MPYVRTETGRPAGTNCKRFYVPGVIVGAECPECGEEVETDLGSEYLSYPSLNAIEIVHLTCPACEEERDLEITIEVPILLTLTVTIAPSDEAE